MMRAWVLAATALLLTGCFPTRTVGTLESRGPAFGDWTITPSDCENGALVGFFGVDLWDSDQPWIQLRLLDDPLDGRIVIVDVGDGDAWVLQSAACERHRIDLRLTNKSINDVRLVDGSMDLACDFGPDGSLTGYVEFKNCKGDTYYR